MFRSLKIAFLGVFALLGTANVMAQEVAARIPELAGNKAYVDLLRYDVQLMTRGDSLANVMSGLRRDMRDMAELRDSLAYRNIDSLSTILHEVEANMLALRREKIKLVDKIHAIEQEHVLSNIANVASAEGQVSGSIFNNSYFRESLFEEDYQVLLDVHKREAEAYGYARQYVANYDKVKSLYDKYLKASTESEAEDIYASIAAVQDENFVVERRLSKLWTEIFDQKTYVYSYFLEKEGREDILELTENLNSEARQQQMMLVDNCSSEAVVDYCLQKPVVLNYEVCVAKLLNLPRSIDSLSNVSRTVLQIDYRLPIMDIERRSFVDYEPIEFRSRTPYNSSNPVPECVVYEYGTIYRILLGTYKLPQATSIFRGAVPLYVEKEQDGRYSYYAGGLRTRAEAEAAVAAMLKKGFRNPRIVEWCDGRKTNLSAAGVTGSVSYRLIIKGGVLDDMVLDVIDSMAKGCQVSRLSDDSFVVGMFESEAVAQRVANAVKKCDANLSVEVSRLE